MTRHPDLPDDVEAAAINADFLARRTDDTGFCNDDGRPAPWPDNLDEWRPSASKPLALKPDEQPF